MSTEPLELHETRRQPTNPFARAVARRTITLATFLALIWTVYLADSLLFRNALAQHGVVPRTLPGLLGILWQPFLHASWAHVASNSLGILLLGGILILRSEPAFWAVSILGALSAGLGTWLIGRGNAVHVGASGVIFAYFGFLLSAGIFERRLISIALSLLVFFLWGGMLWSALPSLHDATISWEGHLSGLAGGILAAKLLTKKPTPLPGPK